MNWTCPFCDRAQTVTTGKLKRSIEPFGIPGAAEGTVGLTYTAIGCSNEECARTCVQVTVAPLTVGSSAWIVDAKKPALFRQTIVPQGTAKPLPNYIPRAIREDYREACLVRDLSPKASATLARRCLQGMIRDFVKPATRSDKLFDEIKALEAAIADGTAPREVSEDSIAALTAVRKIGNIGAHMEADVDVIVDVDPGEAQILLELIESLLQDWYVERQKRRDRFAATAALAEQKALEIRDARAGQAKLPAPE